MKLSIGTAQFGFKYGITNKKGSEKIYFPPIANRAANTTDI